MTDKFHRLYPNADEPKLPISIYNQLLSIMDEGTAFEILTGVEDGLITVEDVIRNYLNN